MARSGAVTAAENGTGVRRPTLDDMDLSVGKKVRLHRIMYEHGPGNGTMMILPIDQGLEHGPRDFFPNPPSADPEYQFRLAKEGGYSAIALQYGLASKYLRKYAGDVPLILKLNGKTEIPPDDEALSPQNSTVEDAIRLGADAVGYTLYVGSPAQERDFHQFMQIREQADRYGLPIIVWAYPRGRAIQTKGGRDSLYAIDYAARVALELGADIIKLNFPKGGGGEEASPKPYNTLNLQPSEAVRKVVTSAGKALVIISGGEKADEADMLNKIQLSMQAGTAGLIFGRNMWQRPLDEAVAMTEKIKDILRQYPG